MTSVSAAVQAEAASAAKAHGQRITVDELARAMQVNPGRAHEITCAMLIDGLWSVTGSTGGRNTYGHDGGLDMVVRVT